MITSSMTVYAKWTVTPGQPYFVGDLGPSGAGIVFYTDAAGVHGLEVAFGEMVAPWYNGTVLDTLAHDTGLGKGKANTAAIVKAQGAGTYAAASCADYRGGGLSDWFLPSQDEVKAMYTYLYKRVPSLGEFSSDVYWTSTQDGGPYWFDLAEGIAFFSSGDSLHYDTKAEFRFRPVREF